MATFNERYGWLWEDGERECRKEAVWKVQRQADKLAEQVRRIKMHAPEFVEPAERAFEAIATSIAKLRKLTITNRGPKYQAISPAEADALLAAAPACSACGRRSPPPRSSSGRCAKRTRTSGGRTRRGGCGRRRISR